MEPSSKEIFVYVSTCNLKNSTWNFNLKVEKQDWNKPARVFNVEKSVYAMVIHPDGKFRRNFVEIYLVIDGTPAWTHAMTITTQIDLLRIQIGFFFELDQLRNAKIISMFVSDNSEMKISFVSDRFFQSKNPKKSEKNRKKSKKNWKNTEHFFENWNYVQSSFQIQDLYQSEE